MRRPCAGPRSRTPGPWSSAASPSRGWPGRHGRAGAAGARDGCTRPARAGRLPSRTSTRHSPGPARIGERRLELAALRARGGDAAVGAQLSADELLGPLEDGVRLAVRAGRPPGRGRLRQPSHGARGQPAAAEQTRSVRADRVLARARASGSQDGVVLALDGLKTVAWHLGDAPALGRGRARSSSRSCESATTPGCCSGWCSSRRSCRPPTTTGTRRGGCCTTRSTSTCAAASRPTPATSRRTTAGWPGSPATSTTRAASAAGPSRRPRPSTTRGGTRGRRVCWPPRSSRRARRRRRSPLPGPGWPH